MCNKVKFFVGLITIAMAGCENAFEYSPYAIDFDNEDTNVNQRNINRLTTTDDDSTIRIAFTGDTHREFDELENFVSAVNDLKNPADFVIHVGDIADFGLPKQYEWSRSILKELTLPYFVCIGNHDLVGNGGVAYQTMYGTYDFTFIYQGIKFIFVNTNSLEFKFNGKVPDVNWLENQLIPDEDFKKAIVIFHIPPTSGDFDGNLEDSFQKTISKYDNVLFTVHGHIHKQEIYRPYADSLTYINVHAVEFNKFDVIEIANDTFQLETYQF